MEQILIFITENADYAHWVIFGLLMLAGFNVPVSEDLMIIIAGVLAGTVVPQNIYKLFLSVFLGSYLSDWISYWLGRKFGKHLWDIPWFARFINKEKLSQVQKYFKKHGFLTLLFGRFIPFGVRNCIFLSALLSVLSYTYHSLRIPVNVFIWLSNFHLFFGFLFLFFIWGEGITPDWLWASVIVILCNGSLQGMTKEFTAQITRTFSQKYVLFSISQGIDKWRASRNELTIKILYSALELLPFFLLSTIIIELVFERLKGLGSILLDNINDIIDNSYDKIDEIFIVIFLLISIVRFAKLFSLWLENRMKTI